MRIHEVAGEGNNDDSWSSAADRAMDLYADGNAEAFEIVYDAVAPRLQSFVRRRTHNLPLTDDIVQQVFLHMHRARSTFVRGAAVQPWAFAIARRLIAEALRCQRDKPAFESLEEQRLTTTTLPPEDQLVAREAARQLASGLEQIPRTQREVFELLKEDGLSLKQAAGRLGISVTAVKLRAHRAIKTLRSVLGRDLR
jgi:RNA polymerase sigma-70 factor, ECF subfamily